MQAKKTPRHIGMIMDGNRRWARKRNKLPWQGHEAGMETFKKVLEWCKEIGIKEITLYTFSVQNFKRSKEEVKHMMRLLKNAADKLLKDEKFLENKHGAKINILGRIDMFPKLLAEKLRKIMQATENNKKYVINMAMAYGGKEEITDAMRKIAEKIEKKELKSRDIKEKTIAKELYTPGEPDMIIRTGGVTRTSNFLPWQSTYSEWFFLKKNWPALEKKDVMKCIAEFGNRERRFGR